MKMQIGMSEQYEIYSGGNIFNKVIKNLCLDYGLCSDPRRFRFYL